MQLKLKANHELITSDYILGLDSENLSEIVTIDIEPTELYNKDAFIEFETDDKYITPKLEITDGVITYAIPNGIMAYGAVKIQVVFTGANNYVWKSFVKNFRVDNSINAGDELAEEYPDFIAEAQAAVDEINEVMPTVRTVVASEQSRVSAEQSRATAEQQRAAAETTRQTNETSRTTAETGRATAEQTRQSNEVTRQQNEAQRQTVYIEKQDQAYWNLTTPVEITDSAGGKIKDVVITAVTKQDGTPTPAQPVEIKNTGSTLLLKINDTLYTISLTDTNGNTITMLQGDEIKKVNGVWKCIKKRNNKIFDGTETFTKRENNNHTFSMFLPVTSISGICSHYKRIAANRIDLEDGIYLDYTITAIITDLRFNTVEEFKAFLQSQYNANTPVTIEYNIGTPQEITLSTETSAILDSIETVKGTANVYFTNEVAPTMAAKYRQDLQAYILHSKGYEMLEDGTINLIIKELNE